MRPILIVLLVLYHSFAIYSGAWDRPEGYEGVQAYKWIARTSYAFMLESFVFLSGYLWSYQRNSLGKVRTFYHTVMDKSARLLIPCWVFSIIYLILFESGNGDYNRLLAILEGEGHLWFLPMLFLFYS